MENEQAICRVCRSGSSVNQPLFHPCKCSGSIRFVHQDCLLQWLSHSNKKYCELCEHYFVFTPIYRQDMPDQLPLNVFIRQSLQALYRGFIVCLRSIIVVFVWLVLLPTFTTWTWRFYFWSGENIGFYVSKDNQTTTENVLRYRWNELLSDCVQGLMTTAIVVVMFVGAYLFRDWVVQNTAQERTLPEQEQLDERGQQITTRLEELRQELKRRREDSEDVVEYNNPYTNGSNFESRFRSNLWDESDNPPSGTQSPFASWRDYQQSNSNSSLNDHHINHANHEGMSRSTNALPEPTDYFENQQVNEEENTPMPAPAPVDNANQEPFEFTENIDGFLEAIGMRGSILTLVQNSMLMTLMINLCLCVTVWIPYVIGRSVILVDPVNLIGALVHIVRLILYPVLCYSLDHVISPLYYHVETLLKLILSDSILVAVQGIHDDMLSCLYFIFKSIHIRLISDDPLLGGSLASLISDTTSTLFVKINGWELIRDNLYSISITLFKRWRQCAFGQGSLDRTVCTCTGYLLLISIGSWYLSRTTNHTGSTNEILRQQGVFLKVLFFMLLELVIFPTVYGVLLDISTLPLFTEWSIKTRFHFVLLNPYSGIFLHWFIGTVFVLQFSVFIELLREVVRPGVLYFLPNPKDPHFEPVQDIVDQPAMTLIRKLCRMAFIYFMLILVGMGLVTILVSKYGGIYPIIYKFNNPISFLPIDLLIVQFLLPPIMKYIVPREFFKKSVMTWWHIASRGLQLSSYMFGGRYPEEEGQNVIFHQHGGVLARVPSYDHVPIVIPRRRMIVPIDSITLEPLDTVERRLGHPAVSKSGSQETDTTIVYIPPYFELRITIFLLLIWATGSILVCSISVVPLLLGRSLFAKLQLGSDRPVHDLYSFALGAYIMILMHSLLNSIVHKYQITRQNHGEVDWVSVKSYISRKSIKAIKFAYVLFMFGLVVPFLLGILLDLYIFMPLRPSSIQQGSFELYPTIDWALGIAGMSLFHGVICVLPHINPTIREQVVQFNWNNIKHLDLWHINQSVVMPLFACLSFMIALPSLLTVVTIYAFAIDDPILKLLIFRCAYPILFCGVCCLAAIYICWRLCKIWLRNIRDNIYLIGRKLHNFEDKVDSCPRTL